MPIVVVVVVAEVYRALSVAVVAEVYRTLPKRKEILRGLLGADLIGFHIYDYVCASSCLCVSDKLMQARHFANSCSRILGSEVLQENKYLFDTINRSCALLPCAAVPYAIVPYLLQLCPTAQLCSCALLPYSAVVPYTVVSYSLQLCPIQLCLALRSSTSQLI